MVASVRLLLPEPSSTQQSGGCGQIISGPTTTACNSFLKGLRPHASKIIVTCGSIHHVIVTCAACCVTFNLACNFYWFLITVSPSQDASRKIQWTRLTQTEFSDVYACKTITYFVVSTETDTPLTRMLFYINSVLNNLFLPSNHISKFYLLWWF
jgi:hypothetical protein